jgi:hypothetical protein
MTGTARTAAGTPAELRSHPVHVFAGRLVARLGELTGEGGVALFGLEAAEVAETLVELATAARRLDALVGRVLVHGEAVDVADEPVPAAVHPPDATRPDPPGPGVPVDPGVVVPASAATSTHAWYAAATASPGGAARRRVELARRLATGPYPATDTALAAGRVDLEQARVVVAALDALPDWVDGDQRARAEAHLLDRARVFDARRLRLLARHLAHVIDPDAADRELAARLTAEAEAAERRTQLTLHDDGQGTCHGTFRIPTLHGAILAKALDALCSPRLPDPLPRPPHPADRLRPQAGAALLGEGFCRLLERYRATDLPTSGGLNPTIVVTLDLQTLRTGAGTATLDTGHRIPAHQARRLACEAGLVPAVLGAASQVLDLGRTTRLFTRAQRTALTLRHRTCTATGCTIPAAWCDAHHTRPWAHGGPTDLDHGTLLCPRHHTRAHHPDYTVTYPTDGTTLITRTRRRRP